MNGYKDLNRALTLQNQEYRQEVARLKNEIILLNRKLMSGIESLQACKCRFARFMQQVALLCNEELSQLNLVPVEKGDQSDTKKDTSRRSVRSVRPALYELQLNEAANKENVSPPRGDDNDKETREMSYVQARRRRRDESGSNDEMRSESINIEDSGQQEELFGDVETVAANVGEEEEMEETDATQELSTEETVEPTQDGEEEDSVPNRFEIPTIREENTADFTKTGTSAHTLYQTTLSSGSSSFGSRNSSLVANPHHTLVPQPKSRQQSKTNLLSVPDISISSASNSSLVAIRTRQKIVDEDTICENFKALQAVSSTPFKQKKPLVRNVVVKLKRLDVNDLTKFGIHSDESRGEKDHKQLKSPKPPGELKRSNRRMNLSPKWSLRSSDRQQLTSTRVSIEGLNGTTSTCQTRPRRNAAPSSLKEPNSRFKLRREE